MTNLAMGLMVAGFCVAHMMKDAVREALHLPKKKDLRRVAHK